MSNTQQRDNSFWVGLFLGGIIGTALIILLGTEKGKKFAKKLTSEGLDFLDDAKDTFTEHSQDVKKQVVMQVEELGEKGAELIQKGKDLIQEGKEFEEQIVEKAISTKGELTDQVIEKADEALEHIEKLQERGRASTAELRKRLFKNIPKKPS